jgi:hypothetical protein
MTDLTKNGMLYHQRRMLDNGQFLFVANPHPSEIARAQVTMRGKFVTKFDLLTGKVHSYRAEAAQGSVSFLLNLEPVGSALFLVTDDDKGEPEYKPPTGAETIVEGTPIEVNRESDNVLVVNYLDLKTSKTDKKDVYFMDALVGLYRENGIEMGNPWQHKIQYKQDYLALDSRFRENSGFEASYHFQIQQDLNPESLKNMRAVVERPELWEVSINGHPVKNTPGQFWIDRDFPVFSIGQFVIAGKNTLTLKAPRMHILAELMPVYILGDFRVQPGAKGFEIAAGNINALGAWSENGLPFYSQKVAYSKTIKVDRLGDASYKVKFGAWNGSVAEVWVNGHNAGIVAWQPYEIDVTRLLNEGDNAIVVKVIGSLKNTFGPFYSQKGAWIVGPHAWNWAPKNTPPASAYDLVGYGLLEPFTLIRVSTKGEPIANP